MDIEDVKAVVEAVRKKYMDDYKGYLPVLEVMSEVCDTIIQQLETTDSIQKAQSQGYQTDS